LARAYTNFPVMPEPSQPGGFRTRVAAFRRQANTSPTDYFPVEQMQMSRSNGEHGELFGSAIGGEMGTQ
jgi:hypothetical protein